MYAATAVAEYKKKLNSAEKQQVQTDVRIRAIGELKYRIVSLEKASDVIGELRSTPQIGTKHIMRYVAQLLDGTIEGYETSVELVAAFKKAQAECPEEWDAVISTMSGIKNHSAYPTNEEYVKDVESFVVAVMKFFIIEREYVFPLSKGGKPNEQN